MIHEIKIPLGLAGALVPQRQVRKHYVTNRILKAMDLFICLKALTTSGHIQNYPDQMPTIKAFAKISSATFYNRLAQLKKLDFLESYKGNIQLCSWEKVLEKYELPKLGFHSINYNIDIKEQNVEYILKGLEIAENKTHQFTAALYKLSKLSNIPGSLEKYYGKNSNLSLAQIHQLQMETFAKGAAEHEYNEIHGFNPDLNRSSKTIRRVFGFHSKRSASYMKAQLQRRGLATVISRGSVECRYPQSNKIHKVRGEIKSLADVLGVIVPDIEQKVLKVKRGSKPKCKTWYPDKSSRKFWYLPDDIRMNSAVFGLVVKKHEKIQKKQVFHAA